MSKLLKSTLMSTSLMALLCAAPASGSPIVNPGGDPKPSVASAASPSNVDPADVERRVQHSRTYWRVPARVYPVFYYYPAYPGITGPNMYFPDPASGIYGYTADGAGYGF